MNGDNNNNNNNNYNNNGTIVNEINTFLKQFGDEIFGEHLHFLRTSRNMFMDNGEQQLITSIYGKHYKFCEWSNDNVESGRDTCACYFYDERMSETRKLISKYVDLRNREKLTIFS